MRALFVLHRYAGIVLCLLMTLWCLSGMVMLYVPYPVMDEGERIAGLAPMDWRGCCTVPKEPGGRFAVEMFAGRPVLRDASGAHDLRGGAALHVSAADALAAARDYARGHVLAAAAPHVETVASDQWTVSGEFNRARPFYLVSLHDDAGTQLYVSAKDGVIRQRTDAVARLWNYLGAVPHWLYFRQLRANAALWAQVVIWSSLAGTFLVAVGLVIGLRQLWRARRAGRWSPYRGVALWHHLPGLLFGIFLLSWVFSGFLSMNPWGLLESEGGGGAARAIQGPPAGGLDTLLQNLAARSAPVIALSSAPLDGKFYAMAETGKGRVRLDAQGREAPFSQSDWNLIAARLTAGPPAILNDGDDYYFSHDGDAATLPVARIIAGDGTRYYLDPASGALLQSFDAAAQGYRWWHQGLHRLDFTAAMRQRPFWDAGMLVLLLGATLLAGTGVYMAVRYLAGRRTPQI